MKIYRQGDVILEKIPRLPDEVAGLYPISKKLSIKGETGNAHVLDCNVFVNGLLSPDTFVQVGKGGAVMAHPQHPAIRIPGGSYLVRKVRTWSPSRIKEVVD